MAKKITANTANADIGAEVTGAADESPPSPDMALVAMHRDYDELLDGPTAADVHPDEVGGWLAAGWLVNVSPTPEAE